MSFDTADMIAITKAVATTIREQVQRAVAPLLERLDQLEPVAGKDGADGKTGEPGPAGKDGNGVTVEDFRQLFDAEHAKWTLEFERRANETVRRFLDKIPKPADGKDGLGFDDMTVEHDGERRVTLRFTRADQIKEFALVLPAMFYRGIWKEGEYRTGDVVTWAGSAFVARRDTSSKPETDDSWQLAVKRGRDGKDGEKGAKGEPGMNGERGRDLTQMGTTGQKW